MKHSYIELEIAFNETNYDTIYNRLYLEGITTILEDNGIIRISLTEENSPIAEKIKNDLIEIDKIAPENIHLGIFDDKDWNKEWEKTIEPIYIKDKIVIYPSWKKNFLDITRANILIEIDPKMSFGTGHNETTQLILEDMCEYIEPGDKSMLDFGCGTAILAIAAVKLGMEKAIAIEIDSDSIENAIDYTETNNVSDKILIYKADLQEIDEKDFDVICANITSNVIIPNLDLMYNKLKPDGKLFITGILVQEKEELMSELRSNGFDVINVNQKAEWLSFYSKKTQ